MIDPGQFLDDRLQPDMEALSARVLAEDGPAVDGTLLPAPEGRAAVAAANRRWNVELPPTTASREVTVPADKRFASAATRAVVHLPRGPVCGAVLFLHGGGWAFCSPESHLRCALVLAEAAGMAVVLPDYRLAPEHPFPAGLNDVAATLQCLVSRPFLFGLEDGPVVVAGDSSGANLALAGLLHSTDGRVAGVAGALLFYGVYNADFATPSYRHFFDGPGLTTPRMRRYWDWYVADAAKRADPLVAPFHASDEALKGLPPLYFTAAGIDPLLFDTLLLVKRLRALGRDDALCVEPGVVHGYLQMTVALKAARLTLAEAGRAARHMAEKGPNPQSRTGETH
jgi:acetyl esterase